jgi:hypothetical protein
MAKLDARNVQDLQLYSTDDLRHLYHLAEGGDACIRLRDGIITREELKADIRRRVWWGRFWNIILATVAIIGMIAAVVAAITGVILLVR